MYMARHCNLSHAKISRIEFTDGELVIGNNTMKYLALLKSNKQKAALLGMRAFWGAAVSHLQAKLPLNNRVLKDLGCLNPLKRELQVYIHLHRESFGKETVTRIRHCSSLG